ncbi:MAG: biotin--[acetyl-CoA-carboxylase] ligase [Actinobacteria bacterium]|nr:biotin--[acetyl-CoA-carboxylase] ligase [Actinomycetota bacterium]
MDRIDRESVAPIIRTRCFGRHLVCLDATSSTNNVARAMALEGAPEGTLVLAEEQRAGRGRLGRRWLAPPGGCLLMSLLLRPPIPPSEAFALTILAGTATARAVERATGLPCQLKWPNDVLVRGRKMAGILCEMSATGDRLDWAVLGIGLNVNLDPALYPEIAATATSVSHELGRSLPRLLLLATLLDELEADYFRFLRDGLAAIRSEWRRRLATLGQWVSVEDGAHYGLAEDVDETGALLLRQSDGTLVRVTVGDAALEYPPGP